MNLLLARSHFEDYYIPDNLKRQINVYRESQNLFKPHTFTEMGYYISYLQVRKKGIHDLINFNLFGFSGSVNSTETIGSTTWSVMTGTMYDYYAPPTYGTWTS